jgi:hypothetical protein
MTPPGAQTNKISVKCGTDSEKYTENEEGGSDRGIISNLLSGNAQH